MIEMLNKEDAKGPSILELAKEIRDRCIQLDYAECIDCPCYDTSNDGCRLHGDDPVSWNIEDGCRIEYTLTIEREETDAE